MTGKVMLWHNRIELEIANAEANDVLNSGDSLP